MRPTVHPAVSLPTDFIAEPEAVMPDLPAESGEVAVGAFHGGETEFRALLSGGVAASR